ncbi:MAG: hypothetical protein M3Z29_05070 [Pseudomonadota bacterium]|nr:hypothetical protein [Pseudomonadota bacterium]
MKTVLLEQRLLSLYKQAVGLRRWDVAEHLLAAIEACAPPDSAMSATVTEAYAIAARVMAPDLVSVAR